MSPPPTGAEHRLRLTDGRWLAWTEYGDPEGVAVVSCHGGLVCRHDASPAAEAARALGLRLISPDRPGVGGSDRQPGRRTVDWAADVTELLDDLGVDRALATGWSAGGQYALALGAELAPRISAVAVVAGCPPLDQPTHLGGLNRMDDVLTALSSRARPVAAATIAALGQLARRAPHQFAVLSAKTLPPVDAEVVVRDGGLTYSSWVAEGLRQPSGVVDDYVALTDAWGFSIDDVDVPVQAWWGTEDNLVARELTDALVGGLSDVHLTVIQGAGHFVAVDRWAEILRPLAAAG